MRQSKGVSTVPSVRDLLVLDRLITGPIVNLMYWGGLAIIALIAFSMIGATVGVAIQEGAMGWLLALPALALGLLFAVVLAAIWRGFCEFYLVVFRISEDLRALRAQNEADSRRPPSA
jgi:hypothetical protein